MEIILLQQSHCCLFTPVTENLTIVTLSEVLISLLRSPHFPNRRVGL